MSEGHLHKLLKDEAVEMLKGEYSCSVVKVEYPFKLEGRLFVIDVVGFSGEKKIAVECVTSSRNLERKRILQKYFDEVIEFDVSDLVSRLRARLQKAGNKELHVNLKKVKRIHVKNLGDKIVFVTDDGEISFNNPPLSSGDMGTIDLDEAHEQAGRCLTKVERNYRKKMINHAYHYLVKAGYYVLRDAVVNGVHVDLLAFKEYEINGQPRRRRVVVECVLAPSKTFIEDKVKKLAPFLDQLIFLVPRFNYCTELANVSFWVYPIKIEID